MATQTNNPALTAADIDQLKEKHGQLFEIQVADESVKYDPYRPPMDESDEVENAVTAFFRKPTDKELSHAMSKLPAIIEAGKVIVKSCFVAGDKRILTETPLLTAAALQCAELLEVRQAKLVKR